MHKKAALVGETIGAGGYSFREGYRGELDQTATKG
jgi:hypothetical protein